MKSFARVSTPVVSVLTVLGLFAGPASEAPNGDVPVTPNAPVCEERVTRTYNNIRWSWVASDGGTIDNSRSSATLSKTFTHTSNESLTTTASGEVGLTVKGVVAEVNAKLGLSVSVTVAYTSSTSFTVSVPARKKVSYQDGIIKRQIQGVTHRIRTNCQESRTVATIFAADNYAVREMSENRPAVRRKRIGAGFDPVAA